MGKCVAWDTELLDPATGELVTAAELHRRGTGGAWVQVVSLDPATGRLVVASPSAFVDDGVKPVYRVRTRLGRTVRTTLSHPFLTEAGWRPLEHLTKGDRIAVPRCLPWFGSERARVQRGGHRGPPARRRRAAQHRRRPHRRAHQQVPLARPRRDGDAAPARPLAPRGSRAAHPGHGVPPRTPQLADLPRPPRGREPRLPAGPPRPGRVRGPLRAASSGTSSTCSCGSASSPSCGRSRSCVAASARSSTCSPWCRSAHRSRSSSWSPRPAGASTRRRGHDSAVGLVPDTDVCWDEIVAIDHDGDDQVYDLTVPGHHNFVAADVIVHNTAFALGMASHVAVEAGAAGAVLLAGDGPQGAHPAHPVVARRGSTRRRCGPGS